MSGTLVSMSHGYQAILIQFLKFLVLSHSEKIKKKLLMIEKIILIFYTQPYIMRKPLIKG